MTRPLSLLVCAGLILAACGNRQLVLDRGVPDEYNVLVRPPLTMPPDFSTLPPAVADGGRTTSAPTIFRATIDTDSTLTAGQQALLDHLGVAAEASDIRRQILEDSSRLSHTPEHIIDKLLEFTRTLTGLNDPPAAVIVDGPNEVRRLQDNLNNARPPSHGSVPTITISP